MKIPPHTTSSLLNSSLVLFFFLLVSCAAPTGSTATSIPIFTPTPGKMECTILPYPVGVKETMSAFIDEFAHVAGSGEAAVTLLLLTDFQCPGCKVLADSISWVQASHPQDVRLIVRYLPDDRYDKSILAMQAAEAAHIQGMFWEMYSFLFETQQEWFAFDPSDFPAWLISRTASLGIDPASFNDDFIGAEVNNRIQQALEQSAALGLLPPILYINSSTPYSGMADVSSLDQTIRLAILETRKIHTCPDWDIDPSRQYIARIQTSRGEIALQLFHDKAPLAVNNFIYLIQQGWYDNTPFHSVEPGFVIQAGDPSGTGYGNPGYYFPTEFAAGLSFDRAGLLAMANTGIGTNGSLFFITLSAMPQLNGQFTIFGEVLAGMDILDLIQESDQILSISVEKH